jgi:hypothetical protein
LISVYGIYHKGSISLLESFPSEGDTPQRVIITLLDNTGIHASGLSTSWLDAMHGTGEILGDIVSPLDPDGNEWEALRA